MKRPLHLVSDQFDLGPVTEGQIACKFIVQPLTLDSIFTALMQLQTVLAPSGVLYATFFALKPGYSWLQPHPRNKWGRQFETYAYKDPYHYPLPVLQDLARHAGFCMDLIDDFGHPTQAMARFRRSRLQRWFSRYEHSS